MSNIKSMKELLPDLSKNKKTTDAPHELGDCFRLLRDLDVVKGKYGEGYWFSHLKKSGVTFYQLKKEIIPKMLEVEGWLLADKKSKLNRGAYLTNRFAELTNNK